MWRMAGGDERGLSLKARRFYQRYASPPEVMPDRRVLAPVVTSDYHAVI
jgi:hypothetical protein